jgi:hypothetical protein
LFLKCFNNKKGFGNEWCNSMIDEQAIVTLYSLARKPWTFISPAFNWIPWHPNWITDTNGRMERPRVMHFFAKKPWEMAASEWPDLAPWWALARGLVDLHPALGQVFDESKLEWKPPKSECSFCSIVEKHTNVPPEEQRAATHECVENGKIACPRLVNDDKIQKEN